MWFTRLAIARPLLIWMALAALAVLGMRAYVAMPAELNPRADVPLLMIMTVYPGAGPAEIEAQVTQPLEEAIGTVGGINSVFSSTQANVSLISLDFRVGTNLDSAIAEVRSRIEAVQSSLPQEVQQPIVSKADINALPILYLGLESKTLSQAALRSLVDDTIRPRLEAVAGVASIQAIGGERREIQVAVATEKLAPFGLTIADVVNSLKAAGRDVPGGSITSGRRETEARLAGAFVSLDAIRHTQIFAPQLLQAQAQPSALPSNSLALPAPPLTIADVADVRSGLAEPTEINRVNGREGVSLLVTKASDANTVNVVESIRRELARLQPSLPADLRVVTLRDDAVTVREALHDVHFTLVLGAILAVVVILLFLHNLRGTFIVALAIPTCIVTTFLMMGLAGFTLNQMTLLALSLSVGILVDDSIVILESITRHLRYGEMPREAALNGRSEIGFADTTTTLVDVVVFVPLAFMGGVVGGFFRQFGLTIAFATLFSLIVSFSVTPMLAARWYRPGEDFEAKRGLFGWFERRYRGLENRYGRVIEWALSHRIWVLLGGVGALAAIFLLSFHRLGGEFLPGADQGSLEVRIEMPPGTSLAATDALAQQVDRMVAELPEVEATASNVGQIVGSFDQLPQQGAQFAQIRVRLKEKRQRSDQEVAAALRAAMPSIATQAGATIQVAAIRSVIGVASPLELRLRGPQIAPLAAFGQRALETMRATPGILNADISTRQGKPETRAVIDPQRAAQFGIPTAQAGAILRDSIAGHRAGVYRENGAEFPIRVRLVNTERDDPVTIGNIIVGSEFSGSGPQPVRLADIADIVAEAGPTNIERLNGMRLVRLTAGIAPGYALENVRRSVERQLRTLSHEGITWEWGGEAATIDENVGPFVWALGLAVLLVYIVMAALFNNLGTPFVIMFTLPMALIGALGALVLTGETLSLISAIGIVMLFGLMGRNAILLLDYTNTLRARGQTRNAALIEAGRTRLRPILMTTTATIVGMLPVALRFGQAAELRAPMAIVVIGGLLVSTILTLVVIPVLYSLFDDGFGGRKKKESALNERT